LSVAFINYAFPVSVKVFWTVTLCGVVVEYQYFRGAYSLLKMEMETLVSYLNSTWCHNPEDLNVNLHCC